MAGASDNGGWPPDGGSSDDLPDLPEEWGVIVIPDDLSELSDEVEAVRAELHLAPPPNRWQRFARRPAVRRLRRAGSLLLRAPVLIVSMAILVTVASLFASAWPGTPRQPATQRTSETTPAPGKTMPALDLIGADGQTVPLLGKKPMVVIITDGCVCDRLIADTVAAVPLRVSVLAVSVTAPTAAASPGTLATAQTPRADGKTLLYLQDPTGHLRQLAGLPPARPDKRTPSDGTAATFVVDDTGRILHTYQHVVSVEGLKPDFARLN